MPDMDDESVLLDPIRVRKASFSFQQYPLPSSLENKNDFANETQHDQAGLFALLA